MSFAYEWTPCRYNVQGWKYVPKGTVQQHLHHPNKVNSVGYTSQIGEYSNINSDLNSVRLKSDSSTVFGIGTSAYEGSPSR